MTIRISFSDKTVRVAVELNGGVESLITELPQREWVGLCDTDIGDEYVRFEIQGGFNRFEYAVRAIEAKLKEKNT